MASSPRRFFSSIKSDKHVDTPMTQFQYRWFVNQTAAEGTKALSFQRNMLAEKQCMA